MIPVDDNNDDDIGVKNNKSKTLKEYIIYRPTPYKFPFE